MQKHVTFFLLTLDSSSSSPSSASLLSPLLSKSLSHLLCSPTTLSLSMNPYLFPSSLFLFFIFIHLPISLSEDNELFIHCRRTFNCGKFSDITYPFYENSYAFYENTRPKECGHPGFELSCHDNTYTIIEINSHKYQVLEIDQTEQILHISLFDFFDLLCPDKYFNTTLNTSLFKFTHDYQNLTLFYGCKPLHEIPSFKSKCLNDGMDSNVYLPAGPTSRDDLLENCSDNVSVPVFESDVNKVLTDPSILGDVLHKGFEVNWIINIRQCQDCVGSDGRCGYNSTTNSFVCFCHDGPCNTTCPASPRKVKLKIGIGVGSGVVGILLTCIVFIICLRRRKRHLSTSTLIPRNISPDPSSKPDLEKGSTYFETPIFSYDELEEATNNFDSTKELGDGGFGTVYKGKLRDGRVVAVKRLYENNCKRVEQFMNEITILSLLRHPNLVSLYGCTSRHSRELLLVYEFIANGTVADHLHGEHTKAGSLTWPIRMNIAIESADALTYLHASDIIHRDVKTTNILLDDNFHVKVADFGLSRLFPTDVTHVSTAPQGTPGYVDPDYHQCYQLTEKSDVYSFGVVLIELISSKQAVDICRHRHEINLANLAINKIQSRALHELVDPFIGFDLDFTIKMKITLVAELAFRCLQQEKEMRPSMREVLEDLRRIKSDEYKTEKVEVDTTADDIGLLKVAPPSPDSVTNKWISNSTTPSTSG